jgi:hypothetical protein
MYLIVNKKYELIKRLKSTVFIVFFFLLFGVSCIKEDSCVEKLQPACACTKQYDPVCGCNGVSYGNACMAECAGISDYSTGACD